MTAASFLQRCLLLIYVPTLMAVLSSSYPSLSGRLQSKNVSIFGRNLLHDDHPVDEDPQRILLLTAHPDDECMFFAPTILKLVEYSRYHERPYPELHSLCLSNGGADGLGRSRELELEASLDILGIPRYNRMMLEDVFQDNITMYWDAELVRDHVRAYVLEHSIDTILTFDAHGISQHPNHISLLIGASKLLTDTGIQSCDVNPEFSVVTAKTPSRQSCDPRRILRIFSLLTVGILPKYSGVVGVSMKRTQLLLCDLIGHFLPLVVCPMEPVFVSSWREYAIALRAMMKHKSQLVWFRWLYVAWSRYMWINDWVEVVA